jgi:hypothetical protein
MLFPRFIGRWTARRDAACAGFVTMMVLAPMPICRR